MAGRFRRVRRQLGIQGDSVRTTFRNRSVPAGLIAVLLGVLSGCGDPESIPEPDIDLSAMILPTAGLTDGECGGSYVDVKDGAGSGGDARLYHATRWWRTELGSTSEGCTLGQYVGFYGDTGRAKEVFGQQSPDKYYAKTWPWKPKFVDAPEGLNADRTQVICLDGAPATGCTEWYYWAQYGKALFKMSMSHLAGDLPKISEGDFLRNVRSADARVNGVLGSL